MKKIQSALISVYYKDGLEPVLQTLHELGIQIYSTGGTQQFIEKLNIPCTPVESLTHYPSILGGRVKTLHPSVFGGILGRRALEQDQQEMRTHAIPEIDLVMVDLYPFEETVAQVTSQQPANEDDRSWEKAIIEKIDIGGPSMIRAAAKNHEDVVVIASKSDYALLVETLQQQQGSTTYEQRRALAIKAFDVCTSYDLAISNYFNHLDLSIPFQAAKKSLRYGENPHQQATFIGNMHELFTQLHGKEISYNNLVDIDAAIQLMREFGTDKALFAIIKHTNVCGLASGHTDTEAWNRALAGDPESAFGGILICNRAISHATAERINELFFEVLLAPGFDAGALSLLQQKKNRILLQTKPGSLPAQQFRSLLNGVLMQDSDTGSTKEWKDVGGHPASGAVEQDLRFANIACKHLKSNAIALVKNEQLIGKGCGQTSRIDSLRQSIDKAKQFSFDLGGAVCASDAFFPFDDCVKMAHAAGITAFIQPGGSVRDQDSIQYCQENGLTMILTGMRHFRH
jgi:phosphoribosylaminoimidazolecarboxamide formyltransferase/IMP cyclohydrolase